MGLASRCVFRLKQARLEASFRPLVALPHAATLWAASRVLRLAGAGRGFGLLCSSHRALVRAGATGGLIQAVERAIAAACRPGADVSALASRQRRIELPPWLVRPAGLVLKPPRVESERVVERGVLLLKNSEFIAAFQSAADLPVILQRYTLVLEPSWSGYANPQLLAYTRFAGHRVLVMASCAEDHEFLVRLGSNLVPIPLGASDWVDPRVFRPLPGVEKEFDAIFVARWALAKRHPVLLDAVRRIGDPGYRVAIAAGSTPTESVEREIRELIRSSPVARQVTIFEPRPQSELNLLLNRSKVNVVLSRQEGSNRSLFEGFFAGVPGIALRSNLGISRNHFTPATGELIADDGLAAALQHFRTRWQDYAPRPWALANIAPEVSARKLNDALRRLAEERGEAWTRDIVAKCNAPNLAYYPDASVGAEWESAEGMMVDSGGPAEAPGDPPLW